MDANAIKVISGINNSKAIFQNGTWIIHGDHNILTEQEPNEYAYKIDMDFSALQNLNPDIPIYASVNSFSDKDIANDYETLADLYSYVKDILQNLDSNDFSKPLKPNLTNNKIIINKLAKLIFGNVTWQSLSTLAEDLKQDIEDNPDCYPYLFKNQEKRLK